jgi:glycosyltransferase involved in cell wall biosynthesis
MRTGLASSFVEWRFWGFPTLDFAYHGVPLQMFHGLDSQDVTVLEDHLTRVGVPDVIWAEGIAMPITLRRVLSLCASSLKVIYPKYCEPWIIEGLDAYDVCLVDEEWQIEEMARRHPVVKCRVWDKLVDYDHVFFPTNTTKKYDICYVARLHPRKNHKLLFQALAKLPDRKLSVVLVGSDSNECQQYLEPMAKEAGVEAVFSGQVPPRRVNDLINESRMGVLCDKYDAVPRAMLECMAADVPVLVNIEMRAGTRYVAPEAGLIRSSAQFHNGIAEILDNIDRFRPREHLLKNYSRQQAADKMWRILRDSMEDKQRSTKQESNAN